MKPTIPLIAVLAFSSATPAAEPAPYSNRDAWQQAVPERFRRRPEFAFVEQDAKLPRVLLIGDSISMSYTVGVRERLAGIANVLRAPDNCRSTRQTLAEIETYLGTGEWDVIHFNWGIHDITHLTEEGRVAPPPAGRLQVDLDQYRRNLRLLIDRLKQTGAQLVWASTTPVGQKTEVKGYRRDSDVVAYNAAAAEIMHSEHVTIDNLYSVVKPRAEELLSDGVHFNRHGMDQLARTVSAAIRSELIRPKS
jgi:acyl-CoA thioesterase-1